MNMNFFKKKMLKKVLVLVLVIPLILLATLFRPISHSVAFANESLVLAGANTTGDTKDDRPDDADDAVGGDQSSAVTTLSQKAKTWAKENNFDLTAFTDYKAPAVHEPTDDDVTAFKSWVNGGSNPRNQVMKALTSAANESIANEIWGYCNTIWKKWMNSANVGSVVSKASGLKNVGAMQEGMFAGYLGSLLNGSNSQDGYANAAKLIKDGFVVSSDGETYRLHNMSDGSVAYEMDAPKTETVSESEFPAGVTTFTDYLPKQSSEANDEAIALLKQYATQNDPKEPANVDKNVYEAVATYINTKFGEYYGQCPGPTVVKGIKASGVSLSALTEDSVGSSVGERQFVASFFGVESAAASLWRLGYLPSFDGKTYRLHSGSDGKVVYSITKEKLDAELKNGGSSTGILLGSIISGVVIVGAGATLIFLKRRKNKQKA